jgi:hypothetical protein
LKQAQEALRQAREAAEAAATPLKRLDDKLQERAALAARLHELRTAHDHEVGIWLSAGAVGERPLPRPECLGAEQSLARMEADASAIASIYDECSAAAAAANRTVGAAGIGLQNAVHNALEECVEPVLVEYALRLREALMVESKLVGLIELLRTKQDNSATQASIKLRELLQATKAGVEVPRDTGPAERLLERLVDDAGAEL